MSNVRIAYETFQKTAPGAQGLSAVSGDLRRAVGHRDDVAPEIPQNT